MSMLEIVETAIDTRAVIPCPAKNFQARRAAIACPKCEHFKGIGRMRAEGEWHQQYVIRCAHIIERRTQIIDVIEE